MVSVKSESHSYLPGIGNETDFDLVNKLMNPTQSRKEGKGHFAVHCKCRQLRTVNSIHCIDSDEDFISRLELAFM